MSNDKIQITNETQNSNIKFQNQSFVIWNFIFGFILDFEF